MKNGFDGCCDMRPNEGDGEDGQDGGDNKLWRKKMHT